MDVSTEQVRALSALQNLVLPESDLGPVALRLSVWLSAMEQIEAELGAQIDSAEPIPPVFPREEF